MLRGLIANCNPQMIAWASSDSVYTLESAATRTRFAPDQLQARAGTPLSRIGLEVVDVAERVWNTVVREG